MPEITERLSTALADRYEIEREIGAGGMATVYLAEDLKHKRKVAVKVLRPELAAVLGAERFVQEITTTANLQHPHILPLHDSGDVDGFLYYVMPFIDGETLRDKLNRETQLSIDEAVGITTDIAGALHYAHGEGVIHRDIKPENILIHNGRPMVADFGIALAVSAAAGGRMTETGMSLGTPHYMSPEQATADKDLTNRSDIYSLASVLYEMLTGEPPHTGGSAQAIVMKIVTDEARPVTELRKSVPPHVAAATGKALAKLAADRFESAKAFAEALSNPAFTTPGVGSPSSTPTAIGSWNRATVATSAVAALLLVVALWGWLRPIPTEPVSHHRIVLGRVMGVATGSVMYGSAISPDGRTIVYVDSTDGGIQLFAKRRDQLEATPIAGTQGGLGPFFSPDGSWIGFIVRGEIRKVRVGGGGALTVADRAEMVTPSATWLEDGTIYYVGDGFQLRRVNANGGESDSVLAAGASFPRGVVQVQALPPSLGILLSGCTPGCARADVWVYDARSDTTRLLVENAWGGWYAPTGHLVYTAVGGDAFAYAFDLDALEVRGGAMPVLAGVAAAGLAFSDAGILLYQRGGSINEKELVWVERNGSATAIASDWIAVFESPALSPDGTRLAVSISDALEEQIWIKKLDDGTLSKISFEGSGNRRPSWSPDGNTVIFTSDREGLQRPYTRRADAIGEAVPVVAPPGLVAEATYTADGAWMVFRTGLGDDLYGLRVGVDTVATPLVVTEHRERQPTVSPDGRWLAYISDESGRYEVYVRPFPNTDGGKWSVSVDGGMEPLWSHSGRELFYKSGGMLVSADIVPGSTFVIGERRPLFGVGQYFTATSYRQYDVTPDDQRFVMVELVGVERGELVLIENWFEVLEERVGN